MQREFIKLGKLALKIDKGNKELIRELLTTLKILCQISKRNYERVLKLLSLWTISETYCEMYKNLSNIPPFLSQDWFERRRENPLLLKTKDIFITKEDIIKRCLKEEKLSKSARNFICILFKTGKITVVKGNTKIVFDHPDDWQDFKDIAEALMEKGKGFRLKV
jgi:hypothetical protein